MDAMTIAQFPLPGGEGWEGQVRAVEPMAGGAYTKGELYPVRVRNGKLEVCNDNQIWCSPVCSIFELLPETPGIGRNGGPALDDDVVNQPKHYTQFVIEPVTFIMRNGLSFWKGNIIKYVCRAGSKLYPGKDERESEIIDLKKVIRYAEMRINQLEGEDVL